MFPRTSLEVAAFDRETARYVVLGENRSFPDPRSAQAAGCIVLRGPLAAAGVVTLAMDRAVEVPRAPLVISSVQGTEYRPPRPKPSPEPPRNARPSRRPR
jgi:hypothetical protein